MYLCICTSTCIYIPIHTHKWREYSCICVIHTHTSTLYIYTHVHTSTQHKYMDVLCVCAHTSILYLTHSHTHAFFLHAHTHMHTENLSVQDTEKMHTHTLIHPPYKRTHYPVQHPCPLRCPAPTPCGAHTCMQALAHTSMCTPLPPQTPMIPPSKAQPDSTPSNSAPLIYIPPLILPHPCSLLTYHSAGGRGGVSGIPLIPKRGWCITLLPQPDAEGGGGGHPGLFYHPSSMAGRSGAKSTWLQPGGSGL